MRCSSPSAHAFAHEDSTLDSLTAPDDTGHTFFRRSDVDEVNFVVVQVIPYSPCGIYGGNMEVTSQQQGVALL
jgi:hypothetical protein